MLMEFYQSIIMMRITMQEDPRMRTSAAVSQMVSTIRIASSYVTTFLLLYHFINLLGSKLNKHSIWLNPSRKFRQVSIIIHVDWIEMCVKQYGLIQIRVNIIITLLSKVSCLYLTRKLSSCGWGFICCHRQFPLQALIDSFEYIGAI